MPTNVDQIVEKLKPARKEKIEKRADELIQEEKLAQKEAIAIFSVGEDESGPRLCATVHADGKIRRATSASTESGIAKLREWAKKISKSSRLTEVVNLEKNIEFSERNKRKLLDESTRTIVLDATDAMAKKLAHASFPDYNGRKFQVRIVPERTPISVHSYWDGGSREYYVALNLLTYKAMEIPENGGMNSSKKLAPISITENFCLVEHSIYMGKDMGLTFIICEKNATALLPSKDNLDKKERGVLLVLRSYKPAFRREYARQLGISAQEYDQIVANLKVKQYVGPTGGITPKGRNSIADIRDIYQLKNESKTPIASVVKLTEEKSFCDSCDRVHETDEACPGMVKEALLTEQAVSFLKNNKNFAMYVAFMFIHGWTGLRFGFSGKGTAEFRSGKYHCYINGDEWRVETMNADVSGTTIEELEDHLADQKI